MCSSVLAEFGDTGQSSLISLVFAANATSKGSHETLRLKQLKDDKQCWSQLHSFPVTDS
jgi:hypothetical protein